MHHNSKSYVDYSKFYVDEAGPRTRSSYCNHNLDLGFKQIVIKSEMSDTISSIETPIETISIIETPIIWMMMFNNLDDDDE